MFLFILFNKNQFSEERKKVLISVFQTQWSERDVSYEYFYLALLFIVEPCEIVNGTHRELDEFGEIYTKRGMSKIKLKLLKS